MARTALQFRTLPRELYSEELIKLLSEMDAVRDMVNEELINLLAKAEPRIADMRAVHSYKLDFTTGQREIKFALQAKPKAKAEAKPTQSLTDWLSGMVQSGQRT